jgi:hypothetical protein
LISAIAFIGEIFMSETKQELLEAKYFLERVIEFEAQ